MEKELLRQLIIEHIKKHPANMISEEQSGGNGVAGMKLYDEPLVGFASAGDELFEKYKNTGIIGPWYMGPGEWLDGAKTVISIFFPYSQRVRESNRGEKTETSIEWLFGRVEGQMFIETVMKELDEILQKEGMKTCIPSSDSRFAQNSGGKGFAGFEDISEGVFASNWSERHAGFACGLGMFGLSKGLITKRGMAGRFGSIIIDAELAPDVRPYTDVYEYCSRCGACIKRCPVEAISLENGKDHVPCKKWMGVTREKYAPRYGCGKCQIKVPCEDRIPVTSR
ncbi:MAG: epoxyqueuosine reductase [Lachnospiraceae bacterium]|nr:epoxyqueuosine reductase [Lachnospiraceae bacterium]